ncbi:MAG: hypothetical protein ACI9XO_001800 [Paraglaciecola sp.]|jgi:hypothetical protein
MNNCGLVLTIHLADILASASDNCDLMPGGQVTQDAFNCDELDKIRLLVSVTDENGLTGSCEANLTVIDLIDPDFYVTAKYKLKK